MPRAVPFGSPGKKEIHAFRLFHNAAASHGAQLHYLTDKPVIRSTVNKVVDQILALREEVGDFGELVYAGMDWVDPALTKRSMELMAAEVMPRVNAAISREGKPSQAH